MSLVEELADQLHIVSVDLPIPQVTAAAERLRMASGLLAWVMHTSTNPSAVPTLGAATEHLEHAAGALLTAKEALTEYVRVLGMRTPGVPTQDLQPHAVLAPAPPPRAATDAGPPAQAELTDWWTARVGEITAGPPGPRPVRPAGTSADLLHRATAAVLADDRDRLRRELAAAGPAVGLGLAAITPPLLRYLAAELVGHPPRLEDLARVRRAALSPVGSMLPAMPGDVAEELAARACQAKTQRHPESAPHHPVDSAAAGAVLVAALLRANGRDGDDLAAVTEQLRSGTEGERVRAGLRLADGDEPRRRSAVDELAGEPGRVRA